MPILVADRKPILSPLTLWNIESGALAPCVLQPDDAAVTAFAGANFICVNT